MQRDILFEVFIGVFIISAIVAFLGITNKVNIKNGFLAPLFAAVILETLGAVIVTYKIYVDNPQALSCVDFSGKWQLKDELPKQIQSFTQSGCTLSGILYGDQGHIFELNITESLAVGYVIRTVDNCTAIMGISIVKKSSDSFEEFLQGFGCNLEKTLPTTKIYLKVN
jgi:hypothetical protein